MSKLIESLCGGENIRREAPRAKVKDSAGIKISDFLRRESTSKGKILDSADCTKVACSLFSMQRSERRKFLQGVTDSVRRQLINEGRRIRKKIVDDGITYDPELCWALENTIDRYDESAEEILREREKNGTFPEEVRRWFKSWKLDENSPITRRLEKLLKPFNLTKVNRIHDDTKVDEFLSEPRKDESKYTEIIEEGAESYDALSEGATEQLEEFKESIQERVTSFIEDLVDEVTNIIPDVASTNAIENAEEETEKNLDETEEENVEAVEEEDDEKDPFDLEYDENKEKEEDGDKVGDSAEDSQPVVAPQPVAAASAPSVKVSCSGGVTNVEVGSGVKVSIDNVEYPGVVASVENGKVRIEGLPEGVGETSLEIPEEEITFEESAEMEPEVPEDDLEDLGESWDDLEDEYPEDAQVVDSVMEKTAPEKDSIVQFDGALYRVLSSSAKSAKVRCLHTGVEIEIPSDRFGSVYTQQPARIMDSVQEDASKVVYDWLNEVSAQLATSPEDQVHKDVFAKLADQLSAIDPHFSLGDDGRSIFYDGVGLMSDDGSTLTVWNTTFIYQATQSGVVTLADQVSDLISDYLDAILEEETLEDSFDAVQDSEFPRLATIKDDDTKIIVAFRDLIHGTVTYVAEDGETSNKDEAKRFTNTREAFYYTRDLTKSGKINKSIFNSIPIEVTDDSSILSDEAKQEVIQKVEEQIKDRLKERGVEIEDGVGSSVNAMRLSVGDEVELPDGKVGTVLKKKLNSFVLRFPDGTHKIMKYPEKMTNVSDSEETLESVEKAISEAEAATNTNPTEEQKESGDYEKGHVTIQGFDIAIENPKGSVRSGVDKDGNPWETEMKNTYGYFEGTKGNDTDDVDVFLGPNPLSQDVFIVDQIKEDGSFDEHKVMFGFDSQEDARAAYLDNYEEGWQGLGNLTKCPIEDFRKWVNSSEDRCKPFTDYLKVQDTMDPNEDGDDRIYSNWDIDKLMEYYNKLRRKALSKEEKEELKIGDSEDVLETDMGRAQDELKQALAAKGVDVDSLEGPSLPSPSPDVKKGQENRCDIPHSAKTFHELRDTERALKDALEVAAKITGSEPMTIEEYKQMRDENPDDPRVQAVADSTLTLDALDLICPELYKRKFTDSVWIADSAEAISDAFNVDTQELGSSPVVVSTRMISPNPVKGVVVDSVMEFDFSGGHKLYVGKIHRG